MRYLASVFLSLLLAGPVLAADAVVSGNLTATGSISTDPTATNEQGQLQLREDSANGTNFKGFKAPDAITADTTCTFEDDANFIPDSCVGNGVDDNNADAITAGDHLTRTVDDIDLDLEMSKFIESFSIHSPAIALSGFDQHAFPYPVTIAFISCSTNAGTATINLEKRGATTPNDAGPDISVADIVCDTNNQGTGGIDGANDNIDSTNVIPPTITAVSAGPAPDVVRVHVTYTIDD